MPLLQAKEITVTIGSKIVLKKVDLTVNRGEIVTLIGPNGAGKSTLVRAVLGLMPVNTGKITLENGITIGYMPQKLSIEPYLPLSVDRFLHLAGGKIPPNRDEILKVVKEVGVMHVLSQAIQHISSGEFQRVLLARALLRKPDLLVLDEPTQGVDVTGQQELYRLIMKVRDQRNCGILMVSHDLHVVMAGTDSVICLNHHICCQGRPEAVSQHPEFINLFGLREPIGIAVYAHDHNHPHDHHAHHAHHGHHVDAADHDHHPVHDHPDHREENS